jgi:hypothetical protein
MGRIINPSILIKVTSSFHILNLPDVHILASGVLTLIRKFLAKHFEPDGLLPKTGTRMEVRRSLRMNEVG